MIISNRHICMDTSTEDINVGPLLPMYSKHSDWYMLIHRLIRVFAVGFVMFLFT